MTDFAQEFFDSAKKVAKMMDLINEVTGVNQPIFLDIDGTRKVLTLRDAPLPESVDETPAPEGE